jgi:hypothetical protein
VDHRLAAVHPQASRQRGDRVIGHREDDELDLLHERRRLGEATGPLDEPAEPLAPLRVAAGDGMDRPAGPRQRDPERGAHGAAADDPDDRRLPRRAVDVRVAVPGGHARGMRVILVAAAVRR